MKYLLRYILIDGFVLFVTIGDIAKWRKHFINPMCFVLSQNKSSYSWKYDFPVEQESADVIGIRILVSLRKKYFSNISIVHN